MRLVCDIRINRAPPDGTTARRRRYQLDPCLMPLSLAGPEGCCSGSVGGRLLLERGAQFGTARLQVGPEAWVLAPEAAPRVALGGSAVPADRADSAQPRGFPSRPIGSRARRNCPARARSSP